MQTHICERVDDRKNELWIFISIELSVSYSLAREVKAKWRNAQFQVIPGASNSFNPSLSWRTVNYYI